MIYLKKSKEHIESVYACAHCSNIFQSPIALPCGVTVCKHHIKDTDKEYFCGACNGDHQIPKGGFEINQALEKMLKSKINALHFGQKYQSMVNSVKKLDDLIGNHKEVSNCEIEKTIGNIKSNIDLKLEQLKHEIDQEAEILIQKMLDSEKKAKECVLKSIDKNVKKIEEEIETSKNDLSVFEENGVE
jgi:hypothetical protein